MSEQPERVVGVRSEPTLVTPPKYGPPPGSNVSAEKWRSLSRKDRRAALREAAAQLNHNRRRRVVAIQREDD